jgi:hypothetical protein
MRRALWLVMLSTLFAVGPRCPFDTAVAGGIQLRSVEMLPPQLPDARSIAITNFGNTALNASYWDGGPAWKAFQVLPSQAFDIRCEIQTCDAPVQFAYHDGAQLQTTSLQRGKAYALYWNSSTSRWSIGPFDSVRSSMLQKLPQK